MVALNRPEGQMLDRTGFGRQSLDSACRIQGPEGRDPTEALLRLRGNTGSL